MKFINCNFKDLKAPLGDKTLEEQFSIGIKNMTRILAGVGKNKNIIEAIDSVDFEVLTTESEEELVQLLFDGFADAAIRGSLSASKIIAK